MQFPRINLNGTDGNVLKQEYQDAYTAVNEAITKLMEVTCHGRDYYMISSEASSVAYKEHRERIAKLEGVRADLAAIHAEIERQLEERKRS